VTLRSRLVLALVTMAAILVAPLFIAYDSLNSMRSALRGVQEQDLNATLLLSRVRTAAVELRQAELQAVYATDTVARGRPSARVADAVSALRALSDSLASYGLNVAHSQLESTLDRVEAAIPAEIDAVRRGRGERADSLSKQLQPVMFRLDSIAERTGALLQQRTADKVEEANVEAGNAQRLTTTAFGFAVALAGLIAIWLTTTISRPVRDLESGMEAVADGDFSYHLGIEPMRHDEFGRLAESYQTMVQQLKQLDQLKAEFVSVASHELKTPINVIIGYLQLLQENVYGDLTPKQRDICLTLASQAQALSRLVRQLLDVSRFEAGGGKLELRPMPLGPFLAELETTFRVLAIQRGVRFHVDRGSRLPDQVVWDEDRMSEVLGNLLANAFKFTDRGGTVELAVSAAADTVTMRVRDTGAGIPPENVPYIFEKFFQADNQASASAKGTGLGLAIAKTIVTEHGGTISVESAVGGGTTFSITLPVRASGGRHHALDDTRLPDHTIEPPSRERFPELSAS
jgi:signal transduction histidine kinase